uniref:Uncharacterized protein n=1 Tax=Megaselia scalaris TaxID=36166 RepID=T1GHZ5_MEGSC
MKNQYNQQKTLIQSALSIVDGPKSKKIVFDDDGEVDSGIETSAKSESKPKSKKMELFDEDDEEEEEFKESLDIKEQFHGKKGAKLMKLQAKMGLDPRFKMDSNFLEDDEEEEEEQADGPKEFDERKWQMGLIEQSLGQKVDHSDVSKEGQKKKLKRSMQRYDPSMEEKFLKQKSTQAPPPFFIKITFKSKIPLHKEKVFRPNTSFHFPTFSSLFFHIFGK